MTAHIHCFYPDPGMSRLTFTLWLGLPTFFLYVTGQFVHVPGVNLLAITACAMWILIITFFVVLFRVDRRQTRSLKARLAAGKLPCPGCLYDLQPPTNGHIRPWCPECGFEHATEPELAKAWLEWKYLGGAIELKLAEPMPPDNSLHGRMDRARSSILRWFNKPLRGWVSLRRSRAGSGRSRSRAGRGA